MVGVVGSSPIAPTNSISYTFELVWAGFQAIVFRLAVGQYVVRIHSGMRQTNLLGGKYFRWCGFCQKVATKRDGMKPGIQRAIANEIYSVGL